MKSCNFDYFSEATKGELKKVQNTLEEMKSSHDSTDNKDEEIKYE